jgi:hypothetical protein
MTYLTRDNVNSINAIGNVRKLEARNNLTGEAKDFRDNVSNDSEHCDASILHFASSSEGKACSILFRGELQWVPVPNRSGRSRHRLIRHLEGRLGGCNVGGSKGGSSCGEEGRDEELHVGKGVSFASLCLSFFVRAAGRSEIQNVLVHVDAR